MIKKMSIVALASAVTLLTAGSAFAAVATGGVNVRTGPGTSYPILDTLARGEHVSVNDQQGGWCLVTKAGPDGWVSCNYLAGGNRGYPDRYSRDYADRYDRGDYGRYDRYNRYDDGYDGYDGYDNGPGVSFGFGGPYGGVSFGN